MQVEDLLPQQFSVQQNDNRLQPISIGLKCQSAQARLIEVSLVRESHQSDYKGIIGLHVNISDVHLAVGKKIPLKEVIRLNSGS